MPVIKTSYELKQHVALKKQKEEAKELMTKLMDLSNVMGNDFQAAASAGMLEAMERQHRTVQQSFVVALNETLEGYSKTRTDPRNEAAVDWAKQVTEINVVFPYI